LGSDRVMLAKEYGQEVCDLQRLMKEAGYYTGKITCNFGSRTVKSVRELQDDNNMPKTGRVTPALLKALYENVISQD
jgi:peptidoglycan hydrolase-like protein with peptidoglycan-binding domain